MSRKVALIAACLLGLLVPAAHAQTDMKLRMDSGFYVGAGIGRAEQRGFCTGLACDTKDFSWNIFAGYQVNRHFAVELGYADFGKATVSGFFPPGLTPGAVSTETTAVELLGIAAVPLTDSFSFYAKAGFFHYDSDGTGTGGALASASDKGTEITFGVGAEYHINRSIGARLEWQRYLSVGSGIFGVDNGDVTVLRLTTRYRF